jgi:HK97 gp10 family phage protein
MARIFLTGDKKLEATLKRLADKEADKIAKSALGAGLTVMVSAIRKAAPVGPTGNLKAGIGKRLEKGKRGGAFTAKAGINVGKRTKAVLSRKNFGPHAHLVALGTKARIRKSIGGKFGYITNPTPSQLSTGTMPKNPFVKHAASSSKTAVRAAMRKRAAKALAKAVAKSK